MSRKTPISIITGYLGSGKTTLLKHILDKSKKKIAILMNEFGEVAIDSKIIKGKAVDIIELAGGCVCCSMIGEFQLAVKEIIEKYNPELIVVETTGVAEPDAIIADIEENIPDVRLESVITVVDADAMIRFPSLGETGRIQIEMADVILVNKTDLVTVEQLQEVHGKVEEINSMALPVDTVNCNVNLSLLFGIEIEREKVEKERKHLEEEGIQSFAYSSEKVFDRQKFEEFANKIPQEVYRSKGFVKFADKSYLFNFVAGRWNLEEFESGKIELVFIGKNVVNLKEKVLKDLENVEIK